MTIKESEMINITYTQMLWTISIIWILLRIYFAVRNKSVSIKREAELLLVYICIIVIARFVFFPFAKADGMIRPLVFDREKMFPPRINIVPFVHMSDYAIKSEAVLNIVGNTAMFVPVGIVWPLVFKKLDSHTKVILAGVGFSLTIEILQLPFFDRVTDIDDLILNSTGYITGFGIYLLCAKIKRIITENSHKKTMPR